MRLRLALIDDHHLFREALRSLLMTQPDLDVVGEAAEAQEAYASAEAWQADVHVVDLALPGVSGTAVVRELGRRFPSSRALILTAHRADDYVEEAFAAGARGYALKEQKAGALFEAIRAVARGELYVAPSLSRPPADEGRRRRGSATSLQDLSPREREIFDLVVAGLSNQYVAKELHISVKTVETHRAKINRKLRVHSTADLVRFAATRGLLLEAALDGSPLENPAALGAAATTVRGGAEP
jgi:DNA-binding NarL/FixJ family response regulator